MPIRGCQYPSSHRAVRGDTDLHRKGQSYDRSWTARAGKATGTPWPPAVPGRQGPRHGGTVPVSGFPNWPSRSPCSCWSLRGQQWHHHPVRLRAGRRRRGADRAGLDTGREPVAVPGRHGPAERGPAYGRRDQPDGQSLPRRQSRAVRRDDEQRQLRPRRWSRSCKPIPTRPPPGPACSASAGRDPGLRRRAHAGDPARRHRGDQPRVRDAKATTLTSVLQAGTAVLIDKYGVPECAATAATR